MNEIFESESKSKNKFFGYLKEGDAFMKRNKSFA
jgi:hypothetical protein